MSPISSSTRTRTLGWSSSTPWSGSRSRVADDGSGSSSRTAASGQGLSVAGSGQSLLEQLAKLDDQIADARSPGRFTGSEAEPRAGVRGGHMPGAANVHFRTLLTAEGTFRPQAQLREIFEKADVDTQKPIVTSCGTGVTAAILMLALDEIGAKDTALYDGSWTEWGARPEAPVVKG
jgi:thiosulfate/3-mercaptopyruvate sulfurtransferase